MAFDHARSLLQNASEHLQTRVQTIFESPPSLGFLPSLQSSGAPTTLPPRMVFSTGGSPPRALSSSGVHVPMSSLPPAAPLYDSTSLPSQLIDRHLLGSAPRVAVGHRHPQEIHADSYASGASGSSGGGGGGHQSSLHDTPDDESHRHRSDNEDPWWDSQACHGFQHPPSQHQLTPESRAAEPYEWGTTWMHYQASRSSQFPFQGGSKYGYCLSLVCVSSGEGGCPLPSNLPPLQVQDKLLFLSSFQYRQFDMNQLKHIQHVFPAYVKDSVFFFWYLCLVSILQGYGFYIPPAQTIHDGEPLGVWFPELPDHVQNDIANIFGDLLSSSFLCNKYSGFLANTAMAQIVNQHENSYLALYDLLVLAGHPLLQAFPSALVELRQQADCRLSNHCLAWGTCLCFQPYALW